MANRPSNPQEPEDDEATVVVRQPVEPAVDPDEETVIVGRAAATDADAGEETVLVARKPPLPDEDDTVSVSGDPVDDEATVVVRHEADEQTVIVARDGDDTVIVRDDESTVVVAKAAQDTTVAVRRRGDESTVASQRDEPTVKVERDTSDMPTVQLDGAGSAAVRPVMTAPTKRRRGELRPAPVPSGFGGMPVVASGAGVVTSYRAREITPPPSYLTTPSESHAPERVLGGIPAVERRSRRMSILTIVTLAASTVLLAGGLIWAIKDLVGA